MNYENSITLFVPRGKVGRVRQVSERASEKSASLNEMRTASEAESKLFSVQPIWVRASRVRTRARARPTTPVAVSHAGKQYSAAVAAAAALPSLAAAAFPHLLP